MGKFLDWLLGRPQAATKRTKAPLPHARTAAPRAKVSAPSTERRGKPNLDFVHTDRGRGVIQDWMKEED